ncbi:DUF1707 SHOCT-like domain-containing protein [Actinoalloteichus caeruleus]|uniref:DUF1707 SHOCT-like domain-containing protein n=1 Tax=Actinoalloteichus cyanogriseus TaxID=2893586 RepID=UPI003AAE5424
MEDFPSPDVRIGDAERAEAVRLLGEHLSAGRLGAEDYGDRAARASSAVTRGDIARLFVDLPEPRPEFLRPPPRPRGDVEPRRHGGTLDFGTVSTIAFCWVAGLAIAFVVRNPVVLLLPLVVTLVLRPRR